MNKRKSELLIYIDTLLLFVICITLFAFPLVFTSAVGDIVTNDIFTMPKQILLGIAVGLGFILLAVRTLIEGKIQLRSTPFDLPIFLFTLVAFLSALFSANRYDALIAFVPLMFASLFYFVVVNAVKNHSSILYIVSSLVLSAVLINILSILSYLKIYILPINYTHIQVFSPLGGLLDQAIFTAIVLSLAGYLAYPLLAHKKIQNIPIVDNFFH